MPLAFDGYTFTRDDFSVLKLRKHYPERTNGESYVIRAFLLAHAEDYDTITFSKRVGHGVTPNPAHLPSLHQRTVGTASIAFRSSSAHCTASSRPSEVCLSGQRVGRARRG